MIGIGLLQREHMVISSWFSICLHGQSEWSVFSTLLSICCSGEGFGLLGMIGEEELGDIGREGGSGINLASEFTLPSPSACKLV